MVDTNNHKVNSDMRFSSEEDTSHYTPIVYKLNENEVIKSGVTCICSYCKCKDKTNCNCLTKLKRSFLIYHTKE